MGARKGAMSQHVERTLRTIFARCVQCPTETPSCPDCPGGQICSLMPRDCDSCAYMTCIANPAPAPPTHKANAGAIAGGIIGGMAFTALVMFILWRFWIKKRREQQELEAEEWEEDEIAQQKHTQFHAMRSDAASTRTRGSIANSILSRASNIIHIAYIPGVTNRSGSARESVMPVPPIPAAYANQTPKSPLSNEGDVLFFRPGSLRGSTYSDGSSIRSGQRDTKYSITPSLARSSVMSDVYRDDATDVPMPATQALRAAPRMVSVKTSAVSSASESIESGSPSNPAKVVVPGETASPLPSSQRSGVGAGAGAGASFGKATQITVGKNKGKGRFPIARQNSDGSLMPSTKHMPAVSSPLVETSAESDDEDEHARARRSLIDATRRAAELSPQTQPAESPFFDASELQTVAVASATSKPDPYAAMSASVRNERSRKGSRGPNDLSAILEEAAKRASADSNHEGTGGKRDQSPFSDAHAAY